MRSLESRKRLRADVQRILCNDGQHLVEGRRPCVAVFFSFPTAASLSPSSSHPFSCSLLKTMENWLKFKVIHFGRKVPSSSLMIAIISHIKGAESSNGKRDWDREWRKAGQASTRATYREIFIQLRRRSTRFWI